MTSPGVWVGIAVAVVGAVIAVWLLVDSFRAERKADPRQGLLTVIRVLAIVYLFPFLLAAYIRLTGQAAELAGSAMIALILTWFSVVGAFVAYLLDFVFARPAE